MPLSALFLALAAAFLHALWNVLLARAADIEAATAVALVTAELVFAPVAVLTWDVRGGVWPYVVATGVMELLYFTLLATAYRIAPLSVVYPVARGGAPVLVLLIGAVVLGRTTTWTQVGAVVLVVAGILLVRGFGGADPRGIVFGLAIAACIDN
jgi:drug/metabolite transporter (DMT)-like permease